MAFKLGMAVDMHGLYAHVRFDDLDRDFCKARPFFFSIFKSRLFFYRPGITFAVDWALKTYLSIYPLPLNPCPVLPLEVNSHRAERTHPAKCILRFPFSSLAIIIYKQWNIKKRKKKEKKRAPFQRAREWIGKFTSRGNFNSPLRNKRDWNDRQVHSVPRG